MTEIKELKKEAQELLDKCLVMEQDIRMRRGATIKEMDITLNTVDGNTAEVVTNMIKGELLAVIVETEKHIDLMITLDSFRDIELLDEREYIGCHYIPLRISPVSKSAKVFNYAPQPWYLNDKLYIRIKGQRNTKARIIIRWR